MDANPSPTSAVIAPNQRSKPVSKPEPESVDTSGKGAYLLISLIVLALDQWSKWLIEANLELYQVVSVIPNFLNLTHVRNTGVAFGLFAAHGDVVGTWLLSTLGLAALIFVGLYFRQVPRSDVMLLSALALVLGGAVGNLVDRVASRGVTDFIDVFVGSYHWHTFNVADSAITVGIVFMLISSFRGHAGDGSGKPSSSKAADSDRAQSGTTG